MSVLAVAGVSKRFGPNTVLKEVSLALEAGEVRAVCGEIRAMLGLKVRYVGFLLHEGQARQLMGRVVVGKRADSRWVSIS